MAGKYKESTVLNYRQHHWDSDECLDHDLDLLQWKQSFNAGQNKD